MILQEKVQDEVRELWQGLRVPVEVRFYGQDGDSSANATMRALWQELQALNSLLTFSESPSPLPRFLPERENEREGPISELWVQGRFTGIRYLGIPSGHEFGGLIETVRSLSTESAPQIGSETRTLLEQLQDDLHLEVFVTPT